MQQSRDPAEIAREQYRGAQQDLERSIARLSRCFREAADAGDLDRCESAIRQLEGEEREILRHREALFPRDRFLADYSVRVLGPHRIAFALPAGVAPIQFLAEAQEATQSAFSQRAVKPELLERWRSLEEAVSSQPNQADLCIDLLFEGRQDRTRWDCTNALPRGVAMASLIEAAMAHSAYYLSLRDTGFTWVSPTQVSSCFCRVKGTLMSFGVEGLSLMPDDDRVRCAVAVRMA